jgi:hypothetical protein
VVKTLVERIRAKDESAKVRASCATALNFLGAKSPEATRRDIPPLLIVLRDDSEEIDVRSRIIWALRPNAGALPDTPGVFETFSAVLKEPKNGVNTMLRYDCAYMLAMVWRDKAPDAALEVLGEFLRDDTIKIFDRSTTQVGGSAVETGGGRATSTEVGRGDGRIMAADALKRMGRARWGGNAAIRRQLETLANDATVFPELRRKAQELIK